MATKMFKKNMPLLAAMLHVLLSVGSLSFGQRGSRGGRSSHSSTKAPRAPKIKTVKAPKAPKEPKIKIAKVPKAPKAPKEPKVAKVPKTKTERSDKCEFCARDKNGKIKRSKEATRAFQRQSPCPSTGKTSGKCSGYVTDHKIPLANGAADHPPYQLWQSNGTPDRKCSECPRTT